MKLGTNCEQLEAAQARADAIFLEQVKLIPIAEQNKIQAIEKAIEILSDANVPAFIFSLVNLDNGKFPRVVQFNNIQKFIKEENGYPDNDSIKTIHLLNKGLIISVVHMLMGKQTVNIRKKSIKEVVELIQEIYGWHLNKYDPVLGNTL